MEIRGSELTSEQIANWMRLEAVRPAPPRTLKRAPAELRTHRQHPGFDFKQARLALSRARKKTDVHTLKPFQRLRRNQGAVNEGLIDAFSALIAVNKQMAGEIAALSGEVATLRLRLAESEIHSAPLEQS